MDYNTLVINPNVGPVRPSIIDNVKPVCPTWDQFALQSVEAFYNQKEDFYRPFRLL